jgi:cytochrome P450
MVVTRLVTWAECFFSSSSTSQEWVRDRANKKSVLKDESVPFLLAAAIIPAVLVLAGGLVVRRRAVRQYEARPNNEKNLPYPPGPKPRFLLGNLLDFPAPSSGVQMEEQFAKWSLEYGPIYTFHVPLLGPRFRTIKFIVCADPDMIKCLTVRRNLRKSPMTYKHLKPVLGSKSMVILEGKEWAAKRRAFNPGFSPVFLKSMVATIAEKLERFVECVEGDISRGEPTNLLERAQNFTSDVIVSVAFGEDWGGSQLQPARQFLNKIAELSQQLTLSVRLQLFGFLHKRKIRMYEQRLDDEMRAVLERRLAAEATAPSSYDSLMDICSIAIREIQKEKGAMTLCEDDKLSIAHQLKTFYFAGHDTTSILIAWAVWLLSLHPEVLEKARSELEEQGVWTKRNLAQPPSYEELQKCVYLEAVLKETLRLYPPVGGLVRHTTECSEMHTEYNGYNLCGAQIILSIYSLHHHLAFWTAPDEFRPSRFIDGSEDRLNDKFIPFSRGPRDCIGKNFAILEAKLAVSALVSFYEFECIDPKERIYAQLTLQPKNGAQVRFRNRDSRP